jgi:hypothetical protein
MTEHKPFTSAQWAALRRELPAIVKTSKARWDTIPLRLPATIGSREGRPRGEKWARSQLEWIARQFEDFQPASRERAHRPPRYRKSLRAAERLSAALHEEIPDMAPEANAIAAKVKARAATARAWQSDKENLAWLFERLLFVWTECGGAETVSTGGERGAGPLIRFLMAASNLVFRRCDRPPPTRDQARWAVRSLLAARRPRPET